MVGKNGAPPSYIQSVGTGSILAIQIAQDEKWDCPRMPVLLIWGAVMYCSVLYSHSMSIMYVGAQPFSPLKTARATLYWLQNFIVSQWRSASTGVICPLFFEPLIWMRRLNWPLMTSDRQSRTDSYCSNHWLPRNYPQRHFVWNGYSRNQLSLLFFLISF